MRVEDYILFVVHHWHFVQSEGITTGGWQSHVRGLLSNEDNVRMLTEAQRKMRLQLDTAVFAMLERWCQLVTKANDIGTACVLHAHMAYLYKNVQSHELNRPIVTTILAAQVFLTTRYVYDIDVKPGEVNARKKLKAERDDEDEGDLGIPDTEVFDLFQKQRWKVLRWLQTDIPQVRNTVHLTAAPSHLLLALCHSHIFPCVSCDSSASGQRGDGGHHPHRHLHRHQGPLLQRRRGRAYATVDEHDGKELCGPIRP